MLFVESSITLVSDTNNISISSTVELDDAIILVESRESNYYFLIDFIPPTNLKIFELSNIFNIEAIRWIVRARNLSRQFLIPIYIIAITHGLSNPNKNLINPLVMCNSPYCIVIAVTSTSPIVILEHFSHMIISTNNIWVWKNISPLLPPVFILFCMMKFKAKSSFKIIGNGIGFKIIHIYNTRSTHISYVVFTM